jgi:hypothetical protein
MDSVFHHYAGRFLEQGFQPIPVIGKVTPLTGWQRYSTDRIDDIALHQMEGTFETYRDLGVALVMGRGVFSIDIDSDDEGLIALLPETPMQKRGEKGVTAFYRVEGEPLSTKRSRVFPVELLAVGAYTVVPPSAHPTKDVRYKWHAGTSAVDINELPALSTHEAETLFHRLEEYCRDNDVLRPVKAVREPESATGEGGVQAPSPGAGGRNNYLTLAAYAMVCQMKMKGRTAAQLADDLLAEDDRAHGAAAWFRDPKEHRNRLTPLARAQAMIDRALKKAEAQNEITAEYKIEIGNDLAPGESTLAEEERPALVSTTPRLIELARPSDYQRLIEGVPLLKAFAVHVSQHAENYSPALTLGSGLVLLGACASNIYEFNEATPNLFVLNCAISGMGKEAAQAGLKNILAEVRRSRGPVYEGFSRYSSSAGIYRNLAQNNRRIRVDVQDEVSKLLGRLSDRQGPHTETVESLSELWSASHRLLTPNAVNDKERRTAEVANPCLLWLGSTTPVGMRSILANDVFAKGLGSRILYFIDHRGMADLDSTFRLRSKRAATRLAPELIDAFYQLLTREPEYRDARIDVNESPSTKAIVCSQPHGDLDAIEAWLGALKAEIIAYAVKRTKTIGTEAAEDDRLCIMLSRRIEIICRLLSIWYVGHQGLRPLGLEACEWANQVCSYSLGAVEQYARQRGSSPLEVVKERVLLAFKGQTVRQDNVRRRVRAELKVVGIDDNGNVAQRLMNEMGADGLCATGISTATRHKQIIFH